MAEREIEHVSRGRKVTPEEAARYRQMRADIEREKPAINAEIRRQLAEQHELQVVFAELKQVRQTLGLGLTDIQQRTGIDHSTLSKLESGQGADFTLDTVRLYAQAVGKRVRLTVVDPT